MGSEILTFGSHCSANFEPILGSFIPKVKLEYDDLENIKTGRVDIVVFNLHQIKQSTFFGDTRWTVRVLCCKARCFMYIEKITSGLTLLRIETKVEIRIRKPLLRKKTTECWKINIVILLEYLYCYC